MNGSSFEPLAIDLVYADAHHPENIFGTAVYHPSAELSLHRDLARIVLRCARSLFQTQGWILVLKDGLRPVDCQKHLMQTPIVQRNPQWVEGTPRLLSAPGQGAHPRGMAVDVSVCTSNGDTIDMGTPFDCMTTQSARDCSDHPAAILNNRRILEQHFLDAAKALSLPLLPLPSEWWDFRFPADYYNNFKALEESDLPPPLRMISPGPAEPEWEEHISRLAKDILLSI